MGIMNVSNLLKLLLLAPLGMIFYFVALKILFKDSFDLLFENILKILGIKGGIRNVFLQQGTEET